MDDGCGFCSAKGEYRQQLKEKTVSEVYNSRGFDVHYCLPEIRRIKQHEYGLFLDNGVAIRARQKARKHRLLRMR